MPNAEDITIQPDLTGGTGDWTITGVVASERINVADWKEPPHKSLANMPALPPTGEWQPLHGVTPVDPEAAKAFIRKYGLFHIETYSRRIESSEVGDFAETAGSRFVVHSEEFAEAQKLFRRAWVGEPSVLQQIQQDARRSVEIGLKEVNTGKTGQAEGIELVATSLLKFMCILFLRDYAAGKISKCANPTCPAPYFIRSRKTQKVCEYGSCSEWAQRQYALRWWNEEGKERRAKERTRSAKRAR
jgi:hypothetical protein